MSFKMKHNKWPNKFKKELKLNFVLKKIVILPEENNK